MQKINHHFSEAAKKREVKNKPTSKANPYYKDDMSKQIENNPKKGNKGSLFW